MKTESTAQISKAKTTENVATSTVKFHALSQLGQLTLVLSSSNDALKYSIIINALKLSPLWCCCLLCLARVERLELPTPGFGDQCSTN